MNQKLQRAVLGITRTASAAALLVAATATPVSAQSHQHPGTTPSPQHGASIQLQALPPPLPQLQMSAEASATVQTDELTVRLAHERDGPVVAPLNGDVLKQLNAALEQAKRVAGVDARMSSLQTNPNWDNAGKRKGWRVRGELELKSKNVAALAELAGKLAESLQLAGVEYAVSPELLQKTRESLIASAAESLKKKAEVTVKALGFSGYEVVQLSLVDGAQGQPPIAFKSRDTAMVAMAESAALPTSGGTERITVTFAGTLGLKR